MPADRQGNTLSGANATALDHYEAAVRAFNIYRGDPVALVDAAIAAAPAMTMAHILKAVLYGLATEPEAAAEARGIVAGARSLPANDREMSLLGALDHLLANNWTAAALALDRHLMDVPHDLVALQFGHLTDFYRAGARNLRDRVARVERGWGKSRAGYSIVLGMYAFGLEEAGDYARAEAVGRQAIDLEPLDCWAHHAVAHVLEMQGRTADGLNWMSSRQPHWDGDDNVFKVHNWWHKALFHLDLDQTAEALALYDGPVRGARSTVALDLVDASALLWRLSLAGVDPGDRWSELAAAWDVHADGRLYPFNDWHAAMAYLGAGQEAKVEGLLAQYPSSPEQVSETAAWGRSTGRALIEGFRAFWHGDDDAAVAALHPARYIANSFGGSHAQRDIVDWTLTEAALRGGMAGVAAAMANERLAAKPHSPLAHGFLKRAGALHARAA